MDRFKRITGREKKSTQKIRNKQNKTRTKKSIKGVNAGSNSQQGRFRVSLKKTAIHVLVSEHVAAVSSLVLTE